MKLVFLIKQNIRIFATINYNFYVTKIQIVASRYIIELQLPTIYTLLQCVY